MIGYFFIGFCISCVMYFFKIKDEHQEVIVDNFTMLFLTQIFWPLVALFYFTETIKNIFNRIRK